MTNDEIIAFAIERAGGMRALGRALKIHYQAIQRWKKIPAGRVLAIEEAFDIPREQLRPDLYRPAPRNRRKQR
jgi:DNA-binding transcriptional regulator YdaS (Cro superfamily)